MTAEQTIAIRRLMEDAVRAASAANESAFFQAQLAELEAAIAHAEMTTGGGHHGRTGDSCLIRPFNISDGKICNCRISAPDAVLTCGDYTIDEDGGDIYVHVDRTDSSGGSSYALSVDQTSRNPSATHAQWTLYKYVDGAATLDCRPGVLPVFSLL